MITLNKEDAFTIVDIISKAQEIVRCKDCKWWDDRYRTIYGEPRCVCTIEGEDMYDVLYRDADDFCSRGEKKDEIN